VCGFLWGRCFLLQSEKDHDTNISCMNQVFLIKDLHPANGLF